MAAPAVGPEATIGESELDLVVEEVIAEHGGDLREAIRALVIARTVLELARDRALDWVSYGYTRGMSNKRDS